jgi:hypothetical protein
MKKEEAAATATRSQGESSNGKEGKVECCSRAY